MRNANHKNATKQHNADAYKPRHFALHDAHVVGLGHGASRHVHIKDGRFGGVHVILPRRHRCRQTVASGLAQSIGVLEGECHGPSAWTHKRAHHVVSLTQTCHVFGQGAVVVPREQGTLKGHATQRVTYRKFETGGRLHGFHTRKGAEGIDFGIDLSQKVGGQTVPFESNNQKVVVASKRLSEFPVEGGFRMVCREELLEVVVEFQPKRLPRHPT